MIFIAIVTADTPITSEKNTQIIEKLKEKYPFLTTQILTNTAFSRPVTAIKLGNGERKVIFTAAHHANEWITSYILLKFAEELAAAIDTNGRIFGILGQNIAKAATIYLVPMVDPDGVDLVTGAIAPGSIQYELGRSLAENYPQIPFPDGWKANLLGVDLNLQYPAGWLRARQIKFAQGYTRPGPRDFVGRAPLHQLEARALAELTKKVNPAMVLAFHTQGKVIYWQYDGLFVEEAERYAREFARLSGYALEETPENSAYAGYKDWFIQEFRRPGFTVEAGIGENPLPLTQFDQIYRDTLGILTTAATGLPGGGGQL